MQQERKDNQKPHIVIWISLLLVGCLLSTGIAAWLYGRTPMEMIWITVLSILAHGTAACSYCRDDFYDDVNCCNREHPGRFVFWSLIIQMISFGMPLLPFTVWPILPLAVLISFFSNVPAGIMAISGCIMTASILANGGIALFMAYFIAGVLGILVFTGLTEEFKVGYPLFISELILLICIMTGLVLPEADWNVFDLFFLSGVNLMVSFLLILLILRLYSGQIIHVKRDCYGNINDPECDILTRLKEYSKDEYYRAIHVAYFCDRIAKKLELDGRLMKAVGYYHNIGMLLGDNTWECTERMCIEVGIPDEVISVLREYRDPHTPLLHKEAVIVGFSEQVISSVLYLFARNPEIKIDYPKLIEGIFKQKMETEQLNCCDITFAELQSMKNIFIEEKLYYDFLR